MFCLFSRRLIAFIFFLLMEIFLKDFWLKRWHLNSSKLMLEDSQAESDLMEKIELF